MTYEPSDCDTLDDAYALMHESYISALKAGFTKHEAMHVLMGEACCKREDD